MNGVYSVDQLLMTCQRTLDDLMWSSYDPYSDNKAIKNLEREIEYLCDLQDAGVVWEPCF